MVTVPRTPLAITQPRRIIQAQKLDLAVPEARNSGKVREEMFKILAGLGVRECVEVNRKKRSIENYVFKFREHYGKDLKFVMRKTTTGNTRIWRVR